MVQQTLAPVLLETWERVYGLGPVQRSLALLNLVKSSSSLEGLLAFTIGERDRDLMELRTRLFGSQVQSLATCPKCTEKIELTFDLDEIRVPSIEGMLSSVAVDVEEQRVTIRPVTCADLLAIETESGPRNRRDALLRRCVTLPSESGNNADWSDDAKRVLVDKLAETDPQADVQLAMTCTRCEHRWSSFFDIAAHLWTEIDVWAQRLLAEVHALASAYGWAEHDIIAMTSWRRQLYLGMLRR